MIRFSGLSGPLSTIAPVLLLVGIAGACQHDRHQESASRVALSYVDPSCDPTRSTCLCAGRLPDGFRELGLGADRLASGIPCVIGDFDADGADDYAFPDRGYDCIRPVRVRVVFTDGHSIGDTATISDVRCAHLYPRREEVGEFGEPPSERDGLVEWGEGGDTKIHLYDGARFVLRTFPSDREATTLEEQAIHAVATLPASHLDPTLPRDRRLTDWLEELCGAGCEWTRGLTDCGEATGDPSLDAGRDLPACIAFEGRRADGLTVGLEVRVGTLRRGRIGEPVFRSAYVVCGGRTRPIARPAALPQVLDSIVRSEEGCVRRPSFRQLCRDRELPGPARHTVRVLLALVGTGDCRAAEQALATRESLDLTNVAATEEFGLESYGGEPPPERRLLAERPLSDLRPLARLTSLRTLRADGNAVVDLAPLSALRELELLSLRGSEPCDLEPLRNQTNLKYLALGTECVRDYAPLHELRSLEHLELQGGRLTEIEWVGRLRRLKYLSLGGHRISELDPVRRLSGLERLYLSYNAIHDLQALADLQQLRHLRLIGNSIRDVRPLSRLTGLRTLWLDENRIVDVSALSTLDRLELLSLGDNPLRSRTCPLPPSAPGSCTF